MKKLLIIIFILFSCVCAFPKTITITPGVEAGPCTSFNNIIYSNSATYTGGFFNVFLDFNNNWGLCFIKEYYLTPVSSTEDFIFSPNLDFFQITKKSGNTNMLGIPLTSTNSIGIYKILNKSEKFRLRLVGTLNTCDFSTKKVTSNFIFYENDWYPVKETDSKTHKNLGAGTMLHGNLYFNKRVGMQFGFQATVYLFDLRISSGISLNKTFAYNFTPELGLTVLF